MSDELDLSPKFNICFICDFFYPRFGGVEMHIFQLGLCLMERGHKVIVVTHAYEGRTGVRYMTNGIKVYYCPFTPFVDQVVLLTLYGTLPLLRNILIRENIHIVHTHAATSTFGNEALMHARTMGYKTVFTDHSLFGFNDAACFHVNKILKFFLSEVDHVVSVSNTSKENLTLRASLNPNIISVIPNAVDCSQFKPDPSKRNPPNTINIVMIGRLTFRKGIDLLVDVIPEICKRFPEAYFIIGGDGPKSKVLEDMIRKHSLQGRIELLGRIKTNQQRNVLVRGHIFINTSLTESFCIAIVEAASCGLYVVSTNVGGVTEVLPKNMVSFANPEPQDIIEKLSNAMSFAKNIPSHQFHEQIKEMYSWNKVARKAEKVYTKIMEEPNPSMLERIRRCYSNGPLAGIFLLILIIFDIFLVKLLNIFVPRKSIETAINVNYKDYQQNKEKLGDHQFTVFRDKSSY